MSFNFFRESYSGNIKEISLGKRDNFITIGGETCYPFYQFEGKMPHKPRIAMEVWDMEPEDWPEAILAPFKDVLSDPASWAKKCINKFGADMIALQLKSADPYGKNASPEQVSKTVRKVLKVINVPLIVWATGNPVKDEYVLKRVAEDCQGNNLILGPVEVKNHKGIGAAAMGFGHSVISSSPVDVNLAKQVNILLENLGMPMDRVILDPTTAGLGYGMEYTYSVMERIRMAAMNQGDDKLQYPIFNNIANEIWKCKEVKQTANEAPSLGDPERRGILMEAVASVTYLMSGSDLLVMRHPEAIRLVKSFINILSDGGTTAKISPIKKRLKYNTKNITTASTYYSPDLKIHKEKKIVSSKNRKSSLKIHKEKKIVLSKSKDSSKEKKEKVPRVFISYAREDYEIAKKIYTDFKKVGLRAWLDMEELLPGQNWKVMITKAISECDFFIALLSSNSLSKRGFIQKELKMAMEILDEFPSEGIFIIPIRLEDCQPVDEKLKYIHWVDIFNSYETGFKKVVHVILGNC